ncbi:MAG: hypothetical protein LBT50_08910 [Prevotellaceae bacterium]|jgi:hypothetical protein|nr:hypothetical protein [Prevotellaceae bacterium]
MKLIAVLIIIFCTGLIISSTNMTVSPLSGTSHQDEFFMLSVPVSLKVHFLKYLFADGGLSVNIHPWKGYKWGIGAGITGVAEYVFRSGMVILPGYRWHGNMLNISNVVNAPTLLTGKYLLKKI